MNDLTTWKRPWSWIWTGKFGGRRPPIGADEYWRHTIVLKSPFRTRGSTPDDPTYAGVVIATPWICRAGLREELDYLRRRDDDDDA